MHDMKRAVHIPSARQIISGAANLARRNPLAVAGLVMIGAQLLLRTSRSASQEFGLLPTEPEMLDRWEDEGGLVTGEALPHPTEAPPEQTRTGAGV